MPTPPSGYYRQLLPADLTDVRLALASQPMTNVVIQEQLSPRLIEHFEALVNDPYAQDYANRLRSGAILPVRPQTQTNHTFAPGELFFRS